MEDQWLGWAKRLQAIASTGLFFTRDPFDRERYEELAAISNAMLAAIGDVPIRRIEGLVSDFSKGYATPKVDVRGAVLDGSTVLLVRERSDGLWTLPGGFADVGLSPVENVLREIREEASIQAEVIGLYSVKHKAKHPYDPDARDFYKLFFLCRAAEPLPGTRGEDSMDAGYFPVNDLPPLSKGRVIERDILDAVAFSADPTSMPRID
jgi:ADP-ribose pyrophosphatase YjhB (NUDIX family)